MKRRTEKQSKKISRAEIKRRVALQVKQKKRRGLVSRLLRNKKHLVERNPIVKIRQQSGVLLSGPERDDKNMEACDTAIQTVQRSIESGIKEVNRAGLGSLRQVQSKYRYHRAKRGIEKEIRKEIEKEAKKERNVVSGKGNPGKRTTVKTTKNQPTNRPVSSGRGKKVRANKTMPLPAKDVKNLRHKRTRMIARKLGYGMTLPVRGAWKAGKFSIQVVTKAIKGIYTTAITFLAFGWILVVACIVVAVFSWLINSPFGIFFSFAWNGNHSSETWTLQEVMDDLDREFNAQISTIQSENTADEVRIIGNRGNWKEILAIYAVRLTMSIDEPQDVVVIDEGRRMMLEEIFWDMNTIQDQMFVIPVESDTQGAEHSVLEITIQKTAIEVLMGYYSFTEEQMNMYNELMDEEQSELWMELLYGEPASPGQLLWPVNGYYEISSPFGYRSSPLGGNSELHRGIDIPAPFGTPVHAAAEGTVIAAGWNDSYGNYVKIDHGDGFVTLYAHNSSLAVTAGQKVSTGEVISYVGSTGDSTGNHCHFEVQINGSLYDPLDYVQRQG